jgi:hypothetical protein
MPVVTWQSARAAERSDSLLPRARLLPHRWAEAYLTAAYLLTSGRH